MSGKFSGKVTLYYNMVMCGTPNKCRAFFADAERCLHYQLQLYGDKLDALHNSTLSPQASRGKVRYLDALPKEFTKEDLVGLRLASNESPMVRTIIYRWVKEGKVVKTGANLWRKCC